MKIIKVESCRDCLYCAQYDNDIATCVRHEMDIEIKPGIFQGTDIPLDGSIHPDCPLEDMPEFPKEEFPSLYAQGKDVGYKRANKMWRDRIQEKINILEFDIEQMKPQLNTMGNIEVAKMISTASHRINILKSLLSDTQPDHVPDAGKMITDDQFRAELGTEINDYINKDKYEWFAEELERRFEKVIKQLTPITHHTDWNGGYTTGISWIKSQLLNSEE